MSHKEILSEPFPATITESGLVQLGNLVEEYQFEQNLSENKLVQLNMLLLTYYFETGNLIHGDISSAIESYFGKHNDREKKAIANSVKFLHENGFLKRNSEYTQISGERK